MSNIVQRYFIKCPYALAKTYLRDELAELSSQGGVLRLRAPLPRAPMIDLSKEVDVFVKPARDPMHFDEPWSVAWSPHGGGLFPVFEGLLCVRADEDWNVAMLELTGSYEPPLGAAGKTFDILVGHTLAGDTARALLRSLGERLVARYQLEESTKHDASAKR